MNKHLPKAPRHPAKPLYLPAAEADAALIASAWKERGLQAALDALFMWQWLNDPCLWEMSAMKARVLTLASTTDA